MGKKSIAIFFVVIILLLSYGERAGAIQEISLEVQKGSVIESVYVTAITGEHTFLPVRQISELINVPLEWNVHMGSVIWYTYGQTTIITPEIDTVYTIRENITSHKMKGKAFSEEGRVYIPLRTLELLGITVAYEPETARRIIFIPENINWPSEKGETEKLNLVRDLIIKERESLPRKMGSFSTYFNPDEKSRTQNLILAAEAVNNYLVAPGKIFSFNESVGPRSPERGYEMATIFVNKEKAEGYGGGICQVSTTLYNAVENAGLPVLERHPHSLPVPYVPLGKDATVNFGTMDFRFINDKERDIAIKAGVEKNKITVEIYLQPEGEEKGEALLD